MDMKEVVLEKNFLQNNRGELCSYSADLAESIVKAGIARWPKDEEIAQVLDVHYKTLEEVSKPQKVSVSRLTPPEGYERPAGTPEKHPDAVAAEEAAEKYGAGETIPVEGALPPSRARRSKAPVAP